MHPTHMCSSAHYNFWVLIGQMVSHGGNSCVKNRPILDIRLDHRKARLLCWCSLQGPSHRGRATEEEDTISVSLKHTGAGIRLLTRLTVLMTISIYM